MLSGGTHSTSTKRTAQSYHKRLTVGSTDEFDSSSYSSGPRIVEGNERTNEQSIQ